MRMSLGPLAAVANLRNVSDGRPYVFHSASGGPRKLLPERIIADIPGRLVSSGRGAGLHYL